MSASLLLPITLLLLSLVCCVQIIRDVALGRYGQVMAGLLWGIIFVAATAISARPLLGLIDSVI